MSPHFDALESVKQAAQSVKDVADRWNAIDLATLTDFIAGLERSACDLSASLQFLETSPPPPANVIRSAILNLKKDAARIERLVDASAAFLRSAPGLASGHDGIYQAGGAIVPVSLPFEIRGMQG